MAVLSTLTIECQFRLAVSMLLMGVDVLAYCAGQVHGAMPEGGEGKDKAKAVKCLFSTESLASYDAVSNVATASNHTVQPANDFRPKLRGFGPLGLLAIVMILLSASISPLISGPVILLWAWLSRTPWHELGYVRPRNWPVTIAAGILAGVLLKIVLKALVMPLLGASPVNRAFQYMVHNPSAALGLLLYIPLGAGLGEETFFRGYFFERMTKLLGSSRVAKGAIVLLSAALFSIAHISGQGRDGAVQAAIVGLVFGTVFAVTGRLIGLMIAHMAFDLTAVALIYYGVEAKVAHFIFR